MIRDCRSTISNTTSDLEDRLLGIEGKLHSLLTRTEGTTDITDELQRQNEEKEVAQHGLLICQQMSEYLSKLRVNVFEEISAAQDARQAIVSTFGDVITAKRVTAGVGATQILGHMSDSSFQQLVGRRDGKDSAGTAIEGDDQRRLC